MEVWRESDDVRIATAQERLMRERPLRVHVSDESLGRAHAHSAAAAIRSPEKTAVEGKAPLPRRPRLLVSGRTGAGVVMFHPRGQARSPRLRSAARRAGTVNRSPRPG